MARATFYLKDTTCETIFKETIEEGQDVNLQRAGNGQTGQLTTAAANGSASRSSIAFASSRNAIEEFQENTSEGEPDGHGNPSR